MVAERAELAATWLRPGRSSPAGHGSLDGRALARPATEHQLAEPAAGSTRFSLAPSRLQVGPTRVQEVGTCGLGKKKISFFGRNALQIAIFLVLYSPSTISTSKNI
jgi:hypothetical protein